MDVHSIVPVHLLDPVFPYQTVVVIFRGLMSTLFSPLSIGALNLTHRVVMAPLTRSRADLQGNVPNNLMVEYYLNVSREVALSSERRPPSPRAPAAGSVRQGSIPTSKLRAGRK
jgi:hypothetical protein